MNINCPKCKKQFDTHRESGEVACPHCGATFPIEAMEETKELPAVAPTDETIAGPKDRRTDETLPAAGPSRRSAATPTDFAGYEILGELGRGGMGIVYKAKDAKLNRIVALKVLIAGEGASQEQVERFFREAESAAKLKHPNIVPIHELDIHEGKHYFTMDFIEGTPLHEVIRSGELTPQKAMEYTEKIARAVHHAHENGIIHRDLKPSNIVISADGRPMVMDFGLAKEVEVESGLTQSGTALGTPSYMSPEQATGASHETDARSDVYSLGAVLYEMLTGRPPFVADNIMGLLNAVVDEDPVPPRMVDPKLSRDAGVICLKCLEKEPSRRYGSAERLADDCRRFLDNAPIKARPASVIYKLRKRLERHKGAALVVAATVAVAALASWGYVRMTAGQIVVPSPRRPIGTKEHPVVGVDVRLVIVAQDGERQPSDSRYSQRRLERALVRRGAVLADVGGATRSEQVEACDVLIVGDVVAQYERTFEKWGRTFIFYELHPSVEILNTLTNTKISWVPPRLKTGHVTLTDKSATAYFVPTLVEALAEKFPALAKP